MDTGRRRPAGDGLAPRRGVQPRQCGGAAQAAADPADAALVTKELGQVLGLEATAANLAGVPLPTLIEAQTVIPDALASQPNPARFGASIVVSAMPLAGWAREVARLLQPSGHLFVYEAHPAVILWTWDEDRPRIREDRSYFGGSHVNDTFPGRGAVEWQWTLGEIITAVAAAGMEILHLGEYPEPFWRAGGISAAAWSGRLPNSFALLARRAQ